MKVLRVIVPSVHDGLGGKHKQGDIITMPDDVAAILVARKTCIPMDEGIIYADEVKKAEERKAELTTVAQKQLAAQHMRHFDDLPPEIRALAREHGDRVLDDAFSGLAPAEIIRKWKDCSTATPSAGSPPTSAPATTGSPSTSDTTRTAKGSSKRTRKPKTTLLPGP